MYEIKKKIIRYIKNQNQIGKYYPINIITKQNYSWCSFFKTMGIINIIFLIFFSVCVLLFTMNIVTTRHFSLINFLLIMLGVTINIVPTYHRLSKINLKPKPIEKELAHLLTTNNLYTCDEHGHVNNQLSLYYVDHGKFIYVDALKKGDKFQKDTDKLGERLESILQYPLEEINSNLKRVRYTFDKTPPKQIVIRNTFDFPSIDYSLKIKVYKGFSINLAKQVSAIVSGSSGAGKSYFTYFYLTRYLSQTIRYTEHGYEKTKHARLLIHDNKQSDLLKLAIRSGMPKEFYGSSVSDAFRLIDKVLNELDLREKKYLMSKKFGVDASELGMPPFILVIEEYSSLIAMMIVNKQKSEFEQKISQIAQKGRQLSIGVILIMQQPRADSIASNIREQLTNANAIFFGNPTQQASLMLFDTTDVPKISGTGRGLYAQERNSPKPFKAPLFESNVFESILPIWKDAVKFWKEEDNQ